MNCSLIICTYNWPEALSLVLDSVITQTVMPEEIIIADDGSEKSTLRVIELFRKQLPVPVIHSWQEDFGCRIPHSRNRAIAKSNSEYIVDIAGDTILHPDFIKDHKKYAQRGVYIQGSRVLLQKFFTNIIFENSIFNHPRFFSNHAKNKINMVRIPFLTYLASYLKSNNIKRVRGCNFSIYREDVIKVNGFNEDITSWGREDSEFVQRLINYGLFKKHLKFSGIQFHIFHNERVINSQGSAKANDYFIEDAIKNNLVWCTNGIDHYL